MSDDIMMMDEFSDMHELVDAAIDRVDLVGKAANGHRFILAKSDQTNLFPSDMVREFIKQSQDEVVKADDMDMDVTEPMAEADLSVDGDEDEPGSPAWEAIDAATATKWAGILARAKNAIHHLMEREEEEIEAGAEEDKDGKRNLEEACEAIEYAISMVAPFAVNEASEAMMADEMGDIEKSIKNIRIKALSTIESFAPIVKAGRELSAENAEAFESAVTSVRKALDMLPDAPEAPEASEEVVKAEMADMADEDLARIAITGMDSERKEALQELGLRSLTQPRPEVSQVMPEETNTDENGETEDDATDTEPAAPETIGTPADEATAVAESQTEETAPDQPEPAPAEDKAPAEKPAEEDKGVKKAIKKAELVAERYESVIKSLEERIAHLEAPAPSRVLSNGALPPAHLMRGQDAGAPKFGDAVAMRKAVDEATDAVAKSEATDAMTQAALAALSELRQNRR
jgi:hypothetical protein